MLCQVGGRHAESNLKAEEDLTVTRDQSELTKQGSSFQPDEVTDVRLRLPQSRPTVCHGFQMPGFFCIAWFVILLVVMVAFVSHSYKSHIALAANQTRCHGAAFEL